MDRQTPLSAYNLPSNEGEVFLFNKSRMRSNSPNPEPENLHVIEVPDPPPAVSSSQAHHPLDNASDPALRALPSYEKEFRHHFQRGKAIYSRALVKFEACEGLLRKQKVQERALEIARGNVDHLFSMILQNYTDFERCYSQQYNRHSSLLKNFERDVDRLRSTKIFPSLQRDNRKCLLDFLNEESLSKAVVDCGSSREQFDGKVFEFKQEFGDLKHRAEELFSERPLFVEGLDLSVKEHQRFINDLKGIVQALSNDVNKVRKLVDECISPQLSSSSLRPHDAVSALGPIYDLHEHTHLPKMANYESSISTLLNLCRAKKNEMNLFVHSYLQRVASVQHTMKDVRYKFSVFHEALNHQGSRFQHLRIVRGLANSYRACLAEVVRRRSATKMYMGKVGKLAEELAAYRDEEIRRREDFLKVHGNYIPGDVLGSMGLYDSPSPFEFDVAPFDADLLDIDIWDIDRYAPEPGSEKLVEVSTSGASKVDVENTVLKGELASKIAFMCLMRAELERESLDRGEIDDLLKNAAERTSQALRMKDEYQRHLQVLLEEKEVLCGSYEKRIQELEQRLSNKDIEGTKIPDDGDVSSFGVETGNPVFGKSEITGKSEARSPEGDGGERLVEMVDSSGIVNPQPEMMELNEKILKLNMELETKKKLLDESQMNCAHLEKCLNDAGEEAHRHLLTADRRASDYNSLHNLFERLKTSVSSASAIDFPDLLRSLARSLSSSDKGTEDQSTTEFLECVGLLSDKVGFLSLQHKELIESSSKLESANEQLNKELEEKKDLVNKLYRKHQYEKQANKEKISFGRLELHEIAAFVQNSSGRYEAINRTCPYYYLSDESVALFSDDNSSTRPKYIIGQIVHIETQVAKPSSPPPQSLVDKSLTSETGPLTLTSNPYGVPVGCEYFVVTVAMLPDISGGGGGSAATVRSS